MTIDLEKALKSSPDQNIKQHAAKIAKALTAAGVVNLTTLYDARGKAHLPTGIGTDIFQVVAYLEKKFVEVEAAETKAAEAKATKADRAEARAEAAQADDKPAAKPTAAKE